MVATTIEGSYEGAVYGLENKDTVSGSQTYPRDLKFILIKLADTTDAADTTTVKLGDYGMTKLLGVKGWAHSTNNSVIVTENPTCTVDEGTVTLTVPAGTDNDARVMLLIGV